VLYALNLTDGKEIWRAPLEQSAALPGSPIIVNDVVYVGAERGALHALDAATGNPIWRFDAGGPITGNPAFADGALFLVTQNGILSRLD
jgi:outer membrane protein assembly factor BamB